jgi:hypothetical protein
LGQDIPSEGPGYHTNAEGTAKAKATEARPTKATEAENLGTTMSEINKLISDMTPEIDEVSTDKASKDTNLDLRHLGGKELSNEDVSELKEFTLASRYKPCSVLFGGVGKDILGCIPDRAGAKNVNTLSKTIGFLKLEQDLSNYRRQHIIGSLFYTNFKVQTLMHVPLNFLTFKLSDFVANFFSLAEFIAK